MKTVFMGHYLEALNELGRRFRVNIAIVEKKPSNKAVVAYCMDKRIPCVTIATYEDILKATEHLGKIDLTIVASFGTILKKSYIRRCRNIVNVHAGDTARYRGRHPLPCAIIDRAKTMGVTIHLIDSEKIDAGPVLAKVIMPIDYSISYAANEKHLRVMIGPLVGSVLERYKAAGAITGFSEPSGKYYTPLSRGEIRCIIGASKLSKAVCR